MAESKNPRLSWSDAAGTSRYRGRVIPLAIVLFLNAAFNVIVWPQFYKRVAKDPRARDANGKATAFLKVHVVLISIALVLALVSVLVGIAALTGAL
jgi:hypothetical protein